MIIKTIFSLLFLPNVLCLGSRIALFTDSVPLEIEGKDCPFGIILDSTFSFSCVCLSGLWAFYDNACDRPNTIIGALEEKCIFINQTVEKVHLLSSPTELKQSATIFTDGMKKLQRRLELDSGTDTLPIDLEGQTKFVLSSGSNSWGLDKKCFGKSQVQQNYCLYEHDVKSKMNLKSSCTTDGSDMIPSESCTPYVTTNSPQCLDILGKAFAPPELTPKHKPIGNGFGRKVVPNADVKSSTDHPASTKGPTEPPAIKEEASDESIDPDVAKPSAIARGRVFLLKRANVTGEVKPAGGNNTDSAIPEYHEDRNLTVNITYPEINSQIWNYLSSRGMEILNLSTPKIQQPLTPNFQFLELSKQIIQKACPDHYVKDGHFDLALQTVINLQKKIFGFNDGFSDFAAKQRIEDSLQLCLQNITEYPFVDPMTITADENGTCSNKTVNFGTFEKFDEQIELNVSWASSGREREPLIETVWKIFTHAHAACYKFFEESGYNDHHRFTSSMMPVFTNGINDIWKGMSKLNEQTYSGILGDPVKLMDGVTYCAEYSKLDTEYPWEIPRPEKEVSQRRKRSITEAKTNSGMCLKDAYDNSCDKVN